jgi:transposase-like protein
MNVAIDDFITELKMLGYKKAKTFVENAKGQLFTYIENWIKTGISNPKVTSLVERTMREIKRRIKKIGFKWSEKGAEKMTRLVLLQLSSTKQYWEQHWLQKTGTNANIKLTFLGVNIVS